jgi:hypothetical protein
MVWGGAAKGAEMANKEAGAGGRWKFMGSEIAVVLR